MSELSKFLLMSVMTSESASPQTEVNKWKAALLVAVGNTGTKIKMFGK